MNVTLLNVHCQGESLSVLLEIEQQRWDVEIVVETIVVGGQTIQVMQGDPMFRQIFAHSQDIANHVLEIAARVYRNELVEFPIALGTLANREEALQSLEEFQRSRCSMTPTGI